MAYVTSPVRTVGLIKADTRVNAGSRWRQLVTEQAPGAAAFRFMQHEKLREVANVFALILSVNKTILEEQ